MLDLRYLLNNIKQNNMNKEFIPQEQALALKQLGFDEPCFTWYWDDIGLFSRLEYDNHNKREHIFSAPTFQQAFRWFREKYGLEGVMQQAKDFTWYRWEISQYNEDGKKYVADWYEYKTYEEAELECIKKLIEIVKIKQHEYKK